MNDPTPSAGRDSSERYSRARHRSRQHASAHAEPADSAPQHVVDHPLVPKSPGEFIATPTALNEFLGHLRQKKIFAYDTEFIGELSYHPRLCLIQASTTDRIGLIDPMVNLDLTAFWELLADPSIEKIVHAGEQDIEPVNRLIAKRAGNFFDTQIASGFVGLAYPVGLSKLVHEMLGVRLGKGLTFTHWDQRPLSPLQLRYASDDVRYLPAVHAELRSRLESLGHLSWNQEECDALCDPLRYGFHPESAYLRIRGATSLSTAGLSVLRELTIWRDAAARAHDIPARAFLKDDILLDMSRQPIKSIDKLARVKGLPRPVEAAHGAAIVEATQRGLGVPSEQRPAAREHEPTPTERFGAESLHALASALCAGQSIDPALVASRQEIGELFRFLTTGEKPDEDDELRVLAGWRAKACGQTLVEMVRGDKSIHLSWRDGRLHSGE